MTRNNARIFGSSILAVGILLLGSLSLAAQDNPSPGTTRSYPTAYGVTAPLRELAKLPQPVEYGFREINPVHRIAEPDWGHVVDTAERGTAFPAAFSIVVNFLGLGNGFPGYTVLTVPPDTNMAVGDDQIVQWVNTSFTVCSKFGTCTLAIAGNALWQSGLPPGSLCTTNNSGEPIAQWDRVAHRWLLAQNVLTSPYAVCIALSDTNDANGTYHVWQFSVPGNNYPDYQKWGVWSTTGTSNGYYQAMNNLGPSGTTPLGALICGYDRKAMLLHTAVTQTCHQFSSTENNLLPGDVDSPTSPPPSQDEFFIGTLLPPTGLSIYSMNWSTGVVHGPFVMTVGSYTPACSAPCIPQQGIPDLLESVGDRLMYRFAYWSGSPGTGGCFYGCDQHWFVNHSVQTGGQIGVRWYEFVYKAGITTAAQLAATTPAPNPVQQQTYSGSPGDMNYRWMGSIARDKAGNVLLGYSESSSSMHPAFELAGRQASDPISQLSDEVVAIAGNGSQTGSSSKWGEYSSMRIDPVDNCTFWYTNEFYMVTLNSDWSTQIISAKFPNCH